MRKGFCKGCRREILFVPTPRGTVMPCELGEVNSEDCNVGERLVTREGLVVTIRGVAKGYGVIGYKPHWGFCTAPNEFRRKRA